MSGKPKRTGWNVNINVEALLDPVFLNLSAEAFAALIWLQVWSANAATDGKVPATAYTPAPPRWPGLPHVTAQTLNELETVGLIWDRDNNGLQVTWQWQTNRSTQREEWRITKQEQRAKQRTENLEIEPKTMGQLEPPPNMSNDVQKTW